MHARIGNSMLQVITQPGTKLPIAGTSTGKALLARYSLSEREVIICQEPQEKQDKLRQELNQIEERGWAFSINESVPGSPLSQVPCMTLRKVHSMPYV